jgi:hypothetical protein
MLLTNTLWFEISIVSIIYALGNIIWDTLKNALKIRRVGKYLLTSIGLFVFLFWQNNIK